MVTWFRANLAAPGPMFSRDQVRLTHRNNWAGHRTYPCHPDTTRVPAPFPQELELAAGPKKTFKAFEKSKFDKDAKGTKEGSKADKSSDKKQFMAFAGKKAKPKK